MNIVHMYTAIKFTQRVVSSHVFPCKYRTSDPIHVSCMTHARVIHANVNFRHGIAWSMQKIKKR